MHKRSPFRHYYFVISFREHIPPARAYIRILLFVFIFLFFVCVRRLSIRLNKIWLLPLRRKPEMWTTDLCREETRYRQRRSGAWLRTPFMPPTAACKIWPIRVHRQTNNDSKSRMYQTLLNETKAVRNKQGQGAAKPMRVPKTIHVLNSSSSFPSNP